ncbi:hypothetical protein MTO96_004983 [Rhipicephalus appendiculatus]
MSCSLPPLKPESPPLKLRLLSLKPDAPPPMSRPRPSSSNSTRPRLPLYSPRLTSRPSPSPSSQPASSASPYKSWRSGDVAVSRSRRRKPARSRH